MELLINFLVVMYLLCNSTSLATGWRCSSNSLPLFDSVHAWNVFYCIEEMDGADGEIVVGFCVKNNLHSECEKD